eukprot:GDKI01039359.1.p1 GENE.GDKI01039359.1~~GDKI01039359.1.p1  ORF type:complete len:346 (-),score=103.82 GDKI01039359.1:23-1060(-)
MSKADSRAYGTFHDVEGGAQQHLAHGKEGKETGKELQTKWMENAYIAVLFAFWYLLNAWYNIDNKRCLNFIKVPYTLSAIQLFIGWFWFFPLWFTGIRAPPKLHSWDAFWTKIFPQGVCHVVTHLGAVVALSAGAVSFVHIVKALEPAFSATLSVAMLGQHMAWQSYLSLFPIIGGVAMASAHELSFSWLAFAGANISNVASSLRAIFAKIAMSNKKDVGENLTQSNMYSLLTIVGALISLPIALIMEGPMLGAMWEEAVSKHGAYPILWAAFSSSISYYAYNEVAYIALGKVHQVTHAVGNTMKRVVIIVTSVWFFSTHLTGLGVAGSAIAILGTFLYAMSKSH